MATELRDFSAEVTGAAIRGVTGSRATLRERIRAWATRHGDRRQLAAFSDEMCRDVGVHRADVACEARKPFWRA